MRLVKITSRVYINPERIISIVKNANQFIILMEEGLEYRIYAGEIYSSIGELLSELQEGASTEAFD